MKQTSRLTRGKALYKFFSLVFCISIVLSLAGCKGLATVVRISDQKILNGTDSEYLGSDMFDTDTYVSDLWEAQALPYMEENAVDYTELVTAIKSDFLKAGKDYGYAKSGNATSYNFIMNCKCKVLGINEESKVSFLQIDAAPYDNNEDFKLLIGPVFTGNSMRDSLSFIKFTDFKSQSDYAKVSEALHHMVSTTVINKIDKTDIVGKEFDLIGTFTADEDDEEYLVTPGIIN